MNEEMGSKAMSKQSNADKHVGRGGIKSRRQNGLQGQGGQGARGVAAPRNQKKMKSKRRMRVTLHQEGQEKDRFIVVGYQED